MTINAFREQFFELLEKPAVVALASHLSPDDDSIGSLLATYTILKERFPHKELRMVYEGTPSKRHNFLKYFNDIHWVPNLGVALSDVEAMVFLDAANYHRFSKNADRLKEIPLRIAIDHHRSPPDDFSLLFQTPEHTSTAELILDLFVEGKKPDRYLAEPLLCGILGDTGGLRHVAPAQSDVLVKVKMLLEAVGESIDSFRARYGGIPKKIIPLLKTLLANMEYEKIGEWLPFAHTFIPQELQESGGYSDEDMSAASHIFMSQYLTAVEGYSWGFVVTPREDGTCRVSSRSLPGSVNVRQLHELLEIGGGHDRASGGKMTDREPPACVEHILHFIATHDPVL